MPYDSVIGRRDVAPLMHGIVQEAPPMANAKPKGDNPDEGTPDGQPFVADPVDAKAGIDLTEFEQGFRGTRTDDTPDEAYTVAGVTSSFDAAQADREAGGGGGAAPLTDEEQADQAAREGTHDQ